VDGREGALVLIRRDESVNCVVSYGGEGHGVEGCFFVDGKHQV